MDVTGHVAAPGDTYTQRSTARIQRSDQLRAELNCLHPILDRDLARIREISSELRRLADEQRRDVIPVPGFQADKIRTWRLLDVLARQADDLAEEDGWAQESLAAEYQGIINQRPRTTEYDRALMNLSGEPLVEARPAPPAEPEISVFVVIFGFIGAVGLLAVMGILAANGHIVTGVLVLFGAAMASKPLVARFIPDLESPRPAAPATPAEPCPGYRAYRTVLNHEIAILNAHLFATDSESEPPFQHGLAIADLLVILGRLRGIVPPTVALRFHETEIRLVDGWATLIREALNGMETEERIQEMNALLQQSNSELHALDAECLAN
jgi:hypothetical protein